MYTKIFALLLQTYLISKASYPPNRNLSIKKVLSTEGFFGLIIGNVVPRSTIFLVIMQCLIYIHIMFLQEMELIPILSDKFSEWNLLEIEFFLCAIGGASLRLWCFSCLQKFFTFNVTVKKDHKLITTGPYALLVHPAYTGGTMMLMNVIYLWYKLSSYVPLCFPGQFGSFIRTFSLFNIAVQTIFLGLVYRRVDYEESVLKKRFDKEWDTYFSQRKRFIPFIY